MKPKAFLRCDYCYATGYKVAIENIPGQVINGRITGEKCNECNGSGYIEFKE